MVPRDLFGAKYSLDIMYYTVGNCQLLTTGNDMSIVFFAMLWRRSSQPKLDA